MEDKLMGTSMPASRWDLPAVQFWPAPSKLFGSRSVIKAVGEKKVFKGERQSYSVHVNQENSEQVQFP